MRRNRIDIQFAIMTCGLILGAGAGVGAGVMPAGAASSPTDLQTTVQAVQNAAAAAVAQATGSAAPTPPGPASNPLPSLPASVAAPITVLSNELGNTMLPGQDSTQRARTRTGQSSPVANADAPVNACSLSVGLAADASSSCSTTSVGAEPAGRTRRRQRADHGAGQRHRAAEPSGFRARLGQRAVRCVDVAERRHQRRRAGEHLLGQRRSGRQHLERLRHRGIERSRRRRQARSMPRSPSPSATRSRRSTATARPTALSSPIPPSQQGQAADVFGPVTACGAIVAVDGSANGMCMPDAGFPLVNDLPTSDGSQSAPVDGVIPVNACSVVVAVAGTASNSCEPTHADLTTGLRPGLRTRDRLRRVGGPQRQCQRHVYRHRIDARRSAPRQPGDRGHRAADVLRHSGCTRGRGRCLVPATVTPPATAAPTSPRRDARVFGLVQRDAGAGELLAIDGRVAGERADGGHGGIRRFVPGVHGRPAAARGRHRGGFAAARSGDQPLRPSPDPAGRSRRLAANAKYAHSPRGTRARGDDIRWREGSCSDNHDAGDVTGLEEVLSITGSSAGHRRPQGTLRKVRSTGRVTQKRSYEECRRRGTGDASGWRRCPIGQSRPRATWIVAPAPADSLRCSLARTSRTRPRRWRRGTRRDACHCCPPGPRNDASRTGTGPSPPSARSWHWLSPA